MNLDIQLASLLISDFVKEKDCLGSWIWKGGPNIASRWIVADKNILINIANIMTKTLKSTLWRQHYDENIVTSTLWRQQYDENININIMIANKATWEWKGALEYESQRSHL